MEIKKPRLLLSKISKTNNPLYPYTSDIPANIAVDMELQDGDQLQWHYNWHNEQAYVTLYPKPLNTQAHLVYEAIKKLGTGHTTGEYTSKYNELAAENSKTPVTNRRVSGIINELEKRNMIMTCTASFGRYGRSKKVIKIF